MIEYFIESIVKGATTTQPIFLYSAAVVLTGGENPPENILTLEEF